MPVKRTIPYSNGTFFITFTCHQWLSLIDKVNGYDIVYKWFDYLKSQQHFINGYVIMPNHIHALLSFSETLKSINTIIGDGKRFMAYEIIDRLKLAKEVELLNTLAANIELQRRNNKKQHNVWELSFDWKECSSLAFANQKLTYIHNNPCKGKWNLCENFFDYKHSSAKFYITGEQGFYPITHIMQMQDINLTKRI